MARYYFIVDDETGVVFRDEGAARDYALKIISELESDPGAAERLTEEIVKANGHDTLVTVRAWKAGTVSLSGGRPTDDALCATKATDVGVPVATLQARWSTLTAREREVMMGVANGLRNKAIAYALGVSEVTVKAHRRHMMLKMGAQTLVAFVRMSDALRRAPGATAPDLVTRASTETSDQ
ncbi:MAG: DNA-binding response regulator [Caulobacteraceae bacterium]|jgi:DNA-binding CsgD family transcriptional regulator|nr:DNA-binding response regulator [Caulobacteraceae bacterium]